MAYHPNIPTPTGVVQDELAQMRENFQHLDQLAQAVDELQTVSGLASVANELQTVSGLAPITDDLQVVSELAPYVQAILDSRIVEMGSNSNGEYVRWENGLQVCWLASITLVYFSTTQLLATWTFPAAFVDSPVVSHHTHGNLPSGAEKRRGFPHTGSRTHTAVNLQYYDGTGPFADGDSVESLPFAIGRWK